MSLRGELNVGQLTRQRYRGDCLLVGFLTFDGTVTAASEWGGRAERKRVRPALPGSHEAQLHECGATSCWLDTHAPEVRRLLVAPRLERAIGVIYRPDTERQSHYFDASLGEQFDVAIHIDHTRALEPLDRTELWDRGEPPETYPSGI
jgi:erythromycin esterase-like protein